MTSGRQRRAVERLTERAVLSPEQADAVLTELDRARAPGVRAGAVVPEILGYVGGVLILGGAWLLGRLYWYELGIPVRVGILTAITFALVLAGVLIGGGPAKLRSVREASVRRFRITTVLLAVAAVTGSMAVNNAFPAEMSGPRALDVFCAALAGLLIGLGGYLVLPSIPGMLVTGAFSAWLALVAPELWLDDSTVAEGFALLLVGTAWTVLAWAGLLRYRELGFAGTAIATYGAQWLTLSEFPVLGYAVGLLVALACFALYLLRGGALLLVVGVIGIALVVPEAVWDWTNGTIGAPLIVVIVGAVLLGAGGVAFRLRERRSPEGADSGSRDR